MRARHRPPVDEDGRGDRRERRRGRRTRAARTRRSSGASRRAIAAKTATWTTLSPQKSSSAAPPRLLELQARELAVAAVEDRVEEEEERPRELDGRAPRTGRRARRRGRSPTADDRHLVRRDARGGEAAADGERDPAVEVPRHEAVGVLDEALQQEVLGAGQVRRGSDRDADRGAAVVRGERLEIPRVHDDVPGQPRRVRRRRPRELAPVPSSAARRPAASATTTRPKPARRAASAVRRMSGRPSSTVSGGMPGVSGATRARTVPRSSPRAGTDGALGRQRLAAAAVGLPGEGEDVGAQRGLGEVVAARARALDLAEKLRDDAAEPVGVVRALGQRREGPLLDGLRAVDVVEREAAAVELELAPACP